MNSNSDSCKYTRLANLKNTESIFSSFFIKANVCRITNISSFFKIRWKQLIPLFCRLTIPTQFWTVYSSNLDWIGLYSTNIEIINKPINWVYLLTCPLDDQGRYCIEFPSLNCGMYRVGYFCTKKKCLQWLSNPFYVKEEPNY